MYDLHEMKLSNRWIIYIQRWRSVVKHAAIFYFRGVWFLLGLLLFININKNQKLSDMDTIKIGENTYNLKYTIRSLFLFEQITKKSFKIETLLDNYVFFYCLLLANNKDNVIDWDDFIDALDQDPTLFQRMSEIIAKQQKKNDLFADDDDDKGGEQKKS